MESKIEDLIDELIEVARPGGQAHRRLLKYRNQVARNVMLGPSVLKYINGLKEKISDNIECRFMTQLGKCRARRMMACGHVESSRDCPLYEASRPQLKGSPLGRIQ